MSKIIHETSRTVVELNDGVVTKRFKPGKKDWSADNDWLVGASEFKFGPEILDMGDNWYSMPYYGPTLAQYLTDNPQCNNLKIAQQIAEMVWELQKFNWAHNDLHGNNIVVDKRKNDVLVLLDFERLTVTSGTVFNLHPDLIGGKNTHAFWDKNESCDIGTLIGLDSTWVISYIKDRILNQLNTFGGPYWERTTKNHIYGDINLPNWKIKGRRDPTKRFEQFGIYNLQGKTVLDIGSNTGSMSFEALSRGAAYVTGLELIKERAQTCCDLAAFAGWQSKCDFYSDDISMLNSVTLASLMADLVFCFAVDHQSKNPTQLYRILRQLTMDTLYFETSKQEHEWVSIAENLKNVGFSTVKFIGTSESSDDRGRVRACFVCK